MLENGALAGRELGVLFDEPESVFHDCLRIGSMIGPGQACYIGKRPSSNQESLPGKREGIVVVKREQDIGSPR